MTISVKTGIIKTVRDRRLAYLAALEKSYREMGYGTRLNGRENVLEVFEKGVEVPPLAIEKFFDGTF